MEGLGFGVYLVFHCEAMRFEIELCCITSSTESLSLQYCASRRLAGLQVETAPFRSHRTSTTQVQQQRRPVFDYGYVMNVLFSLHTGHITLCSTATNRK